MQNIAKKAVTIINVKWVRTFFQHDKKIGIAGGVVQTIVSGKIKIA